MVGRDILDPECPGSPPSFEEHFTFMWDLYLERERYQKDQSPDFRLAEREALDPDDSNPIVKLSMTRQVIEVVVEWLMSYFSDKKAILCTYGNWQNVVL